MTQAINSFIQRVNFVNPSNKSFIGRVKPVAGGELSPESFQSIAAALHNGDLSNLDKEQLCRLAHQLYIELDEYRLTGWQSDNGRREIPPFESYTGMWGQFSDEQLFFNLIGQQRIVEPNAAESGFSEPIERNDET